MKIQGIAFFALILIASSAYAQIPPAPTQSVPITLTWQDNAGKDPKIANQEDGTRIERRLGTTGTFAVVGQVPRDAVTYTDVIANDPGNQQYCWRVQSFNKTGSSPGYSNVSCATTPPVEAAPPTPSNLITAFQQALKAILDFKP